MKKLKKYLNNKYLKITALAVVVIVIVFLVIGYQSNQQLMNLYQKQKSTVIKGRDGSIISIELNPKRHWARYLNQVPSDFKKLLLRKEDQHFYRHFGINPWSTYRAARGYFGWGPKAGSSTITQQLVKILLGNESERNLRNKIIEAFYTLNLEIFQSKEQILKMYVNSIYFGNQAQGLAEAGRLHFDVPPELLTEGQTLQLLSTISSPTAHNPSKAANREVAKAIAPELGLNPGKLNLTPPSEVKENMRNRSHSTQSYFEVKSLLKNDKSSKLTIDQNLNRKARKIVKSELKDLESKNVGSGAVVIIKLPENEILSLVGSPDPGSEKEGHKINMTTEPRAIGSTIKPFIYLKGFEKELRPYTLVNDREYKYITKIGFPLYPKNYDYQYRGEVTLHYALSNSLNVPTVKVLEHVQLDNFYKFLRRDLEFESVQDLEKYQLGIALGGLEMSLLNLTEYYTIFPNQGFLKESKLVLKEEQEAKRVAKPEYIQLVNKILNDRKTGMAQFGMQSSFNLFQDNYALKTGTSREYQDSWIVGYTPDFIVGAWVGNPNNESMEKVSGQVGAGRIWAEVMEVMLNSKYNEKTSFDFSQVKEFQKKESVQYGLAGDNYQEALNTLIEKERGLILKPHPYDQFLLEKDTKIALEAKKEVKWFANHEFLKQSQEAYFTPKEPVPVKIRAVTSDKSDQVTIQVRAEAY